MSDPGLSCEILQQIEDALHRIERRFSVIDSPDDFLATDDGIDRLDAICMMLIAIGESLKNLDRLTGGTLLSEYPSVDWKGAKGMRGHFPPLFRPECRGCLRYLQKSYPRHGYCCSDYDK